jgi:hypothetical protein
MARFSRIIVLATASLGVVALAGCGDTCGSKPAAVDTSGTGSAATLVGCSGGTAQIQVQLCPECTDSSPSCQAEFVGNRIEVAPAFQTCQSQSGCTPTGGCGVTSNTVVCSAALTQSGNFAVVDAANNQLGTLTVNGTSCTFAVSARPSVR